jgi:hypothetical protein
MTSFFSKKNTVILHLLTYASILMFMFIIPRSVMGLRSILYVIAELSGDGSRRISDVPHARRPASW